MDITVYVLKSSGGIECKRVGNPENLIYAVETEGKDFTLTPPPNYLQPWYWYDNKWQSDPKPTAE